jgi:hypothetical protein
VLDADPSFRPVRRRDGYRQPGGRAFREAARLVGMPSHDTRTWLITAHRELTTSLAHDDARVVA